MDAEKQNSLPDEKREEDEDLRMDFDISSETDNMISNFPEQVDPTSPSSPAHHLYLFHKDGVDMKVKEIQQTTFTTAWSPAAHHPIYLAAGTAGLLLDATSSTTAALEIYALNLTEPGLDMCMKGSLVSDLRFHKIVWGCEGMKSSDLSSGVIVGGADGGNIMIYDAAKLIQGDSAILHQSTKHTGPVHSLDFNNFQESYFASGANEEIFIWDLNNATHPVLGAKSPPLQDLRSLEFSKHSRQLMACSFSNRCAIWDIREKSPDVEVTHEQNCSQAAWNTKNEYEICISSDDDENPIISLWDLRMLTLPVNVLKDHHTKGILAISWNYEDPDLLLSCGRDSRILCWNPHSNVEMKFPVDAPTNGKNSFDISWCPRNSGLFVNNFSDGSAAIFSITKDLRQVSFSNTVCENIQGAEEILQDELEKSIALKAPPIWFRKPFGASFGVIETLVQFGIQSEQQCQSPIVHITQAVTGKLAPDNVRDPPRNCPNQVLEDIFGDLQTQCHHPMEQLSGRLQVYSEKLKNLYEILRSKNISYEVTLHLQRVIQAINQNEYDASLCDLKQLNQKRDIIRDYASFLTELIDTAASINVWNTVINKVLENQ